MADEVVKFIRRHDYRLIRELGQGACGQTVLLHDDQIDEFFVCKKFVPYDERQRRDLFQSFVRETKILHRIQHESIVRVFNYYLYPEIFTGYILMEFVDGHDVENFLASQPEYLNEVFSQVISGFAYLESNGILHRDIRPANLMVTGEGRLKVIDFGFGKQINAPADFDKSVTLNWWCEPPKEFAQSTYDFQTEAYFVGMLFERIIRDGALGDFQYPDLLNHMCQHDPADRISGFLEAEKDLQGNRFFEIAFTDEERDAYRAFADALSAHVTKIESDATYQDNVDRVLNSLENLYRAFMLERYVPNAASVVRCFLRGNYYYAGHHGLGVSVVRSFLQALKAASPEKRRIILSNLQTRLDAITRYDESEQEPEDIPF